MIESILACDVLNEKQSDSDVSLLWAQYCSACFSDNQFVANNRIMCYDKIR